MSRHTLMGRDKIGSVLRSALEQSSADQTEARIVAAKASLTRFANSTIHQNMVSSDAELHVRAVFGKKAASASSNRLDEAGVRELVDAVIEMARAQDENPDFVSLPEGNGRAPEAVGYSAATANSAPEDRARAIESVIGESDKVGATAAGSLAARVYELAVMNSLGVDSYCRGTASWLTNVVTGPEGGFGYGAAIASDIYDIDAAAVGSEAASRAYESRNPVDLEPGEYECVLMPYAVAAMMGGLAYMGFGALAYQEGRSFVCGKLGEKIVSDAVSLWDDGLDPRGLPKPFDSEGVLKQRVDLIRDGVANALLYDSYTAHREGEESTGHAPSGMAGNLVVAPGNSDLPSMIASVKRGLLVTRFHYTNAAHLMSTTITGMTRDGTFLIENGKVTGPVKNLRFTQSVTEALSGDVMIGSELKLAEGVLAPAMKVSKFRFSSATAF